MSGGTLQTFVDSAPLLGDADALRARLAEQGYLYFRGLMDPQPLLELRAEILRTIAAHGWVEDGSDPLDAKPSWPMRQHAGPGWRPGYIAIQKLESFHRLAHDAALCGMLRQVLGDDLLVHGQRIARVIWPAEPDITTPAHQDYTHIQGTADFLTCWIPLGDCPAEQGGLRLLPGSHRGGIRPVRASSGAGGIASFVDEPDDAWATTDYSTGDVIAFHSFTVHAGMPNTTDRLRLSVDYRYQSARDPVAVNSINPHNHPYVPAWDELTPGWQSTEWVPRVDELDVTTMHLPTNLDSWHTELGRPPSRFLEVV